jgi:hypothetical protein
MHTFLVLFWSFLGVLMLVVAPIALIATAIAHFRTPASQRPGSGAMSNALGASLQELDRLMARPSIEFQMEAEQAKLEEDEDSSGDPLRK